MSKSNEERDIYYIPPNFLASGRLFGGMIRARNAIEACVLVLLTGIPIIKLPMSLTVRIIILCLLPLPLGIFGIIGFEGDSLSEFAINWVRWFIHRRSLYRSDVTIPETARKQKKRIWEQEATKPPKELGIRIKQPRKKRKRPTKTEKQLNKNNRKMVPSHKKQVTYSEDFVPVKDIRNGIIEMEDGRYIRVLEVEPINFLLRSTSEQKNIVASFASWMKISPIKIQIKVLTKKADIGKHLSTIERDMESESNPKCRELQLDYYRLIQTIGSREAITRRFLVIFEYEAVTNRKPEYSEIVSALETSVQTARQYFLHCDNAVVTHDDENAFLLEILYTIFNRSTCEVKTVEQRIGELQLARRDTDITVPVSLKSVLAPDSIDLTHGSYVVMDGVYHAYLIVPSDGYNPRVVAGWTSILVNAGEGIDVDFYFFREPKERIQAKLGQQIRINRSRLKDTSDTNSDFDDFESAIRSGYFLKEGLANYEDFYYCNTLVTITADTLENLEWRISEVRRLMVSQDMDIRICRFRQEQALLSILPLCSLNKKLFEASKRNMLTSAAASCYPFTSFEMSDENGILLGVNQHNNSLVIVDIFNSRVYKNANMVLLGTSGAGKTFTLQLIALRMRRKGMTILSSTPLARSTVRTGSKSILALRKVNPIMRRNLNMKLNRLLTLYCALSMALGMVTFASAADYSFKTSPDPVYYGSTNYEDLYDAEYRYGSRNQIDYDIPEIQYGLSQEFLESSLNNPYLNGNTQYGFGGSSSSTQYPESDFGSSSIISGGGTIEMPYEPSVTLNDLKQSDGSIGQVSIDRVGLNCKVYEGATDSSMSKGAGHYSSSGLYTGNVGLFGHNRGNHPYFGKLKNVKDGDIVKYKTAIGTKTYKVTFVGAISYTDFSYLNEMGDNRITLITCIANQPSLRLCVQAVEIR